MSRSNGAFFDDIQYPTTWRILELGETGTWRSGGTPSTSNPVYWDGATPWISAATLRVFDLLDSDRKVTDLGLKNGTRAVGAGVVIFVVRGMSLKFEFRVGVAGGTVAFGQDYKAIEGKRGIHGGFLAYSLKAAEPIDGGRS